MFQGSDGNSYETGAQIVAEVDGTPGDGDMPGRLVFKTTADGASSASERIRITNAGNVGIGISTPSSILEINSDTYPQFIINGTDIQEISVSYSRVQLIEGV